MWKILGENAIYLDLASTAKNIFMKHEGDDEKIQTFRKIIDKSEFSFLLNGETEEGAFFIRVSNDITPDEIQLMADIVLEILKNAEIPFVTVGDVEQRYKIIITNDIEPELIGLNKTPGMSSAEIFKPILKALDGRGRLNSDFL